MTMHAAAPKPGSEAEIWTEDRLRILNSARELGDAIRTAADDIDASRGVPAHIVEALSQAGVFRMSFPRSWGGPEMTPAHQFEVIEAIAQADGSTGWCAYIGANGGYFTAYLDQDEARSMFPTPESMDAATGGVPTPIGTAEVADGGYVISGRWSFGSGIRHSKWFVVGALVRQDGKVVLDEAGQPRAIAAFLPTSDIEIHDTWNATGLRGTGSHDFEVHAKFVAAERTFNFYSSPPRRPSALYAFPNIFFFNHSAVVLGIARSAIDTFKELCRTKKTPWGQLERQPFAVDALARAEAAVGAARSYALETLRDLYAALETQKSLSLEDAARFRLTITHCHRAAVEAVDLVFNAAGTTAVKVPSILDRCFRDVHTANQHLVASPMSYSIIGAMMLGTVPADPLYFPPRKG